uniref:hypothetical protein n=1 Tax=Marinobacterium profundum TaxID=1714300 RepID=UPI00082AFE60|nr:hypothetical protein [Marinobacterium profundum]
MKLQLLPGGLFIEGTLRQDYRFNPLNGALELSLEEAAAEDGCTADKVTAVLACALASLAGQEPDRLLVASLVVGDRQFLMRQLSVLLDDSQRWLSARCSDCDAVFDLNYRPSSLPIKSAGQDFPESAVQINGTSYRLRLPTGADQSNLDPRKSSEEQQLQLLASLLNPIPDVSTLSPQDIEILDQTLESMAPEVALQLLAPCPHCQMENTLDLDPYQSLDSSPDALLSEIHRLASSYHWSQQEILDLPRRRRQHYLQLIESNRNSHTMEAGH